MAVNVREDEVITLISELLRSGVAADEESYQFEVRHAVDLPAEVTRVTKQRVAELVATLATKEEREETALFNRDGYERLVKDESRFAFSLHRTGAIFKEDSENGLTYVLGPPTDDYLIFLLAKLSTLGSIRLLRGLTLTSYRLRDLVRRDNPTVFDLARVYLPRLLTVQVRSAKVRGFQDLSRHANAFLFQLTYNLDAPIVEARYLDDLLRSGRIVRNRRSKIEDIEPPRRFYIPDLVYQYQMGVASDSALLEYLSYFHVAEHFFEEVFNEDLINSVRDRITQPDFSYRRKRDINELIRYINKRLKNRGDAVVFSELEALRLTLERFVDVAELAESIRKYQASLLTYYANTRVPFSEGDLVDLTSADTPAVTAALARRIYKTRNAIVHSKEGERERYVPYQHDQMLLKEVPLLRFIAERIIKTTSVLF